VGRQEPEQAAAEQPREPEPELPALVQGPAAAAARVLAQAASVQQRQLRRPARQPDHWQVRHPEQRVHRK
jgi:hypothetical protein